MSKIDQIITTITNQGTLPLYFNKDETVSIEILRALYRAGIKAIEYTHRGVEATENFKKMIAVRDAEMFDLLIGIGTIKNERQTEAYLELGADFFISPGFVPEVAALLKSKEILYIPGCMTPTEIIAAENKGIQFIKLFPGNKIEPDFLSSIKDIFPDLIFMPTGGVDTTKENIQAWFDAGVSAVGMGSKLISKKLMDEKDYQTIENQTKNVLNIIKTINK
ncbi:2-dehydro-3-deoxyphosphogluconate aldolase / (4S)-4-hydroxy-2-oxoglutarate aldolase [Flavobacterium aquidurense]|uniref:Bifunctional 4-hydroxy-2-oxoglutarate aldolase/2-dehydro-3-deoxy-phosphogluconate aldolase n=1 Tax=Flavobacterium frigidimaris TaxID=262320 RepID=A0ABX4BQ10_FLAFR|nr:bifunctional 4-hydroxy-2-oxoglutarate aldolase/2-dehydro-3-deoxy-phosphogluconate aldolase [Flavobacterium frigidimaris]OXA78440.1 bifunctional 4-hydroxy-2-oxoglutarate aldolase/2-dehydro-3-deoxy-phosphogluconate aldolase [Flavobacterium frigidimaris]SDZ62790.1 2-dehydro-3-deoxyphosphogluconate aldolase / (4S)-4-hydroxy-2-oxoglutarate aldolase [Flavobacterium aquidurense]